MEDEPEEVRTAFLGPEFVALELAFAVIGAFSSAWFLVKEYNETCKRTKCDTALIWWSALGLLLHGVAAYSLFFMTRGLEEDEKLEVHSYIADGAAVALAPMALVGVLTMAVIGRNSPSASW